MPRAKTSTTSRTVEIGSPPPPPQPSMLGDGPALTIGDLLGIPKPPPRERTPTEPNLDEMYTDSIYRFREDAVFPTKNEWGLPELREDMLSDIVPVTTWGREGPPTDPSLFIYSTFSFITPPEYAAGHVLGFYVDDNKFETVWRNAVKIAERLVRFPWGGVVMPDFSLIGDDPTVIRMYNLYRSLWCARYWQEAGIKVIPNLRWEDGDPSWIYAGFPKKPPVAAIEVRSANPARSATTRTWLIRGVRAAIEHVQPETVVFYGAEHRNWIAPELPPKHRYVWLPSYTAARSERGLIAKRGA